MPAFLPLLGDQPKILILGSMPGRVSLDVDEYYAHPRNAFWPIMSNLFDVTLDAKYEQRVRELTACGICVWDVLHDCERPGSLDSKIVIESERVNDFESFFATQTCLKIVGFNGHAARAIFARHFKSMYVRLPHIQWVDLPSSSPAHAAMRYDEKERLWRERLIAS